MSNIIYEDKYFNESVKQEFVSNYANNTQKILNRLFKVSRIVEEELNKDLYSFNRDELRRLLYLYSPTTEYSSRANVTWISKYISWALDEGYATGLNPLDTVSKEWKEQFVVKSVKKYWTDNDLDMIIADCANANDGVIISLLRNGVGGKASSEILNLKFVDVNRDANELTLRDENEVIRTIKVSEECIKLCVRSSLELEYEKMNGNGSDTIKAKTLSLVDNEYILKSANTRTNHFEAAEKNIVHRRLVKISKELNEPYFIPMNIQASGMLEMAKNLYVDQGKLDNEHYEIIFQQFAETAESGKNRIKAEYLNIDTIKDLYKLP